MDRQFRHELKYYISRQGYAVLAPRLRTVMHYDENANEDGRYHIRSLYFDDADDTDLRSKIDGLDDREKIRVRIYDFTDTVIKLERKEKAGQYVLKESMSITHAEYDSLKNGDPTFLLSRKEQPAGKVFLRMKHNGLRPVKVVDYFREAYVFPVEETRITFDMDLRMGADDFEIFNRNMLTVPMLEKGIIILEIKFNNFLPEIVRNLLQGIPTTRYAISKYAICRRYDG
jgi:hypothetical protein